MLLDPRVFVPPPLSDCGFRSPTRPNRDHTWTVFDPPRMTSPFALGRWRDDDTKREENDEGSLLFRPLFVSVVVVGVVVVDFCQAILPPPRIRMGAGVPPPKKREVYSVFTLSSTLLSTLYCLV